jgi:hypothetical protein
MEPVDLGWAKARLDELTRRSRELIFGSIGLAAAGLIAAIAVHTQLTFSLAFGAAVGLAFSYLARAERSSLLMRVVAQGDASLVEGADAYARKLASSPMRLRLARGLERAAASGRPGLHEYTWVRPERAFDVCEELLRLAAGFRDLAVSVTPASAALCRRLLCEAAASPLYNPKIPEAELVRVLGLIAAGFGHKRDSAHR